MADIASSELNLRELRILQRAAARTQHHPDRRAAGNDAARYQQGAAASPRAVWRSPVRAQRACHAADGQGARNRGSVARAARRRRQSARLGDGVRSRPIGPHLQSPADRCRDDPLPASPDRARWRPSRRRVNIRAMPLDSRQFELKLEAGEGDLALGAFPKAPRHLRRQRLYFDGYVTVVRKGHPRIAAAAVPRRISRPAPYPRRRHRRPVMPRMAPPSACSPRRYLLQISCCGSRASSPAPSSRRKPTASPRLPANLAKRLAGPLGLAVLETPIALPRIEITQYWHERYHRDAAHRWFRSVTFELFGPAANARKPDEASK